MAFKSIDSGVLYSKGRGAARVELRISFAELERWAKRNAVDTQKLLDKSFGKAASGLKRQLVAVMKNGGGVNGVPRFKTYEDFTAELRREQGRDPTGPIGGILCDKGNIVAFKRGGWQYVGWPDRMENLVEAFQEGRGGSQSEKWFTDSDYRASWHRQGIREIPRSYVHNPRAVLEPHFHDHIVKNLDDWAHKIFYKDLAKQMVERRGA